MATVVNLIILTLLGRIQEIIEFLAVVKPVMVMTAIGAITLFFFWPWSEIGAKWRRPTLFWLLASLGFALSVAFSLERSRSVGFLATTYLCTTLLFLLVSQCVRRFATLESISLAIVVMSLLHGVAILVAPTEQKTDSGAIRYSISGKYDPNDLACVYAMEVPFLFYWFWRGGLAMKSISVLATALAVYGIYLTGSRGGLVALGVVVLYLFLRVREIGPVLRGMLVVAMLLGAVVVTRTETFHQLILAVQGKDYNTTEEDGRLQIWRRGVRYALTHPITGVGVQCFEVAEGNLSGRSSSVHGIKWSAAHNSYIQVLAENGIFTFFCWVAMIVTSLSELDRQRRVLDPWRREPAVHRILVFRAMVRAALLAFAVGGFFLSLGYLEFLYLLIAMTIALAEITDNLYDELVSESAEESEEESALPEETAHALPTR